MRARAPHIAGKTTCGAIALLTALGPAAAESSVPPGAPSQIELTYAFYAGGLRVANVTGSAQLDANSYSANAILKTEGTLSSMFDVTFSFQSIGKRNAGRFDPETFAAAFKGFEGNPTTTVSFSPSDRKPVEVKPDLPRGLTLEDFRGVPPLVDPMSAVLEATVRAAEAPCNKTFDLFDGVRSYRIILERPEKDDVHTFEGSIYEGPAVRCRWRYELVKASRDDWALDLFEETPPEGKIWFAELKGMMAPVRLMAETPVVNVVMHVMSAQVNGQDAAVDEDANTFAPAKNEPENR